MNTTPPSPAHTPGPWFFDPVHRIVFDVPVKLGVATVEQFGTSEEIEANGYLIAAAPDLLRELKVAERFLNLLPESERQSLEDHLCQSLSLADLRAAIARAEGT